VVICREQGADCSHVVQRMPLHHKTPSPLASFTSRLQGGPKQQGHRFMTVILSNLSGFIKKISLEDSVVKLQLKYI